MSYFIDDVVIVLPGILGSKLKYKGEIVWGQFSTLPKMLDERYFDTLGNLDLVLEPVGLVSGARILPGLALVDGYAQFLPWVEKTFGLVHSETLFEFGYDWRQDIRKTAQLLKSFAVEVLNRVRSDINPGARLILIAHSMGGLVSRYYVEVLEGWRDTKALVTLGTPFRGSLNALRCLVNGVSLLDIRHEKLSKLCRKLDSLYQLVPMYPCVIDGSGSPRGVLDMRDMDIDHQKLGQLQTMHTELRESINSNQADTDYAKSACRCLPIVGTNQSTKQSAWVRENNRLDFRETDPFDGSDLRGDGTVPYVSAVTESLKHFCKFANAKHGTMPNVDVVRQAVFECVQALYVNFDAYATPHFQKTTDEILGFEMDNIAESRKSIQVAYSSSMSENLRLIISKEDGPGRQFSLMVEDSGHGIFQLEDGLEPGTYNVALTCPSGEVRDVLFVV